MLCSNTILTLILLLADVVHTNIATAAADAAYHYINMMYDFMMEFNNMYDC